MNRHLIINRHDSEVAPVQGIAYASDDPSFPLPRPRDEFS